MQWLADETHILVVVGSSPTLATKQSFSEKIVLIEKSKIILLLGMPWFRLGMDQKLATCS